jgi:ABC-type transport system involved in multi-copper enzyme maturation permease subunit
MSAQTRTASIPPPEPSLRFIPRARVSWARLWSDPNPVWMRELRQAARLQRTPFILATVTGMMTLLICSVGGVASATMEPARVGVAIFHTFFSLAFAVVTWVGPAVAANTIAGERSGRTWEALLLTGLSTASIARGKFLSAFTYISLYIVMLAPVGALPFLFGGVTALEVLLAFGFLFLIAALAVAFGLAVSSKFNSPATAIIVTLLGALPVSMLVYGACGVGLSFAAHDLWSGVPGGPPVWLPGAYQRADFGLPYIAFLVLLPLLLTTLPAWLFYEITVANMAAPSDDRSTRLRVWFLVSAPALTLAAIVVNRATHSVAWVHATASLLWLFACISAFLFAGEPLGPSVRVLTHWQRQNAGRLRRFLGPGVLGAASLLLLFGSLALVVNGAVGITLLSSVRDRSAIIALHGYAAAFLGFSVGFVAWARARSQGSAAPRLGLLVALFFACIGPWVAMAIAGLLTNSHDQALLLAAPSPTYVITMIQAIESSSPDEPMIVLAGTVCAAAWALIGTGLLALASVRIRQRLRQEADSRAELARRLDAEDGLG